MKKLLWLLLLLAPTLMQAQSTAYYSTQALGVNPYSPGAGATPTPVFLPYSQVRVCTATASGIPCSPTSGNVYDQFGSIASVPSGSFGQFTTDVTGRWTMQCTPGNFLVQVEAPGSNTPGSQYLMTCPFFTTGFILTTKGDLLGYGTGPARVPVGTDGTCLIADSSQPLGVNYLPCTGTSGVTVGAGSQFQVAFYNPANKVVGNSFLTENGTGVLGFSGSNFNYSRVGLFTNTYSGAMTESIAGNRGSTTPAGSNMNWVLSGTAGGGGSFQIDSTGTGNHAGLCIGCNGGTNNTMFLVNGGHFFGMKGNNTNDWTMTMPPNVPSTNGQVLTGQTSGVTSWTTGGVGTPNTGTSGFVQIGSMFLVWNDGPTRGNSEGQDTTTLPMTCPTAVDSAQVTYVQESAGAAADDGWYQFDSATTSTVVTMKQGTGGTLANSHPRVLVICH